MHDPQLVPAFTSAPIPAPERAPAAIMSQIAVRPTPKQAQTIGPALAEPSADLPESKVRRWSSPSASAANRLLTAFQSQGSRAGPTNRQVSMRFSENDAARNTPPPKSRYSARSPPAAERIQACHRARSTLSANR